MGTKQEMKEELEGNKCREFTLYRGAGREGKWSLGWVQCFTPTCRSVACAFLSLGGSGTAARVALMGQSYPRSRKKKPQKIKFYTCGHKCHGTNPMSPKLERKMSSFEQFQKLWFPNVFSHFSILGSSCRVVAANSALDDSLPAFNACRIRRKLKHLVMIPKIPPGGIPRATKTPKSGGKKGI